MELDLTFPAGLDVAWEAASAAQALPVRARSWLLDTGSLTDRIESLTDKFSLALVGEGNAPLHDAELSCLSAVAPPDGDGKYIVREVLLQNGGTPWVFARSVIPVVLMETEFNQLGSQPLGKRLFNDDRFERGAFELCKVGNSSFAGDTGITLLGRRSCFHYRQHALLVAELFLPASPVYQTER